MGELGSPLLAACVCALVSHVLIRRWLAASAVSAGVFAAGCLVHSHFTFGPLNAFFLLWGAVAGFFGFAVATAMAVPFVVFRGPRAP